MKILEPQVELIHQGDDEALHIAKCARICYASNKLVDNEKMCNHLWKNHHHSMFRHVGVYYKIPYNEIYKAFFIHNLLYNPYCNVAKILIIFMFLLIDNMLKNIYKNFLNMKYLTK